MTVQFVMPLQKYNRSFETGLCMLCEYYACLKYTYVFWETCAAFESICNSLHEIAGLWHKVKPITASEQCDKSMRTFIAKKSGTIRLGTLLHRQ